MAKIVFFQETLHEKFGVMSISGFLKKHGHQCEVFCDGEEENLIEVIEKAKPDIIGCSVMMGEINFILRYLKKIKKRNPGVPVIIGGPLTLIYPEEIISKTEVDMMLLGDGEMATLDILNKKELMEIDGLWFKKNGKIIKSSKMGYVKDLTVLPPVDWDLYSNRYKKIKKQFTRNFFISRGCVYNCTYCYAHCIAEIYKPTGIHFRTRDVKQCIEEIKYLKATTEVKYIRFQDASLTINRPFLMEFLKEYKKAELPKFICYSRFESIDEGIADALKDAGCDRIQFGLQSFERMRNLIGRKCSDEKISEVIKMVQKRGIRAGVDLMFGFPTETTREALLSLKFYNKLMPIEIFSNMLMVYPKTEIWNFALENGYINETKIDDINSKTLTIKQKNIKQLINIDCLCYYFIKHTKLLFLFQWLIYLPPNRLFNFLKEIPSIKRTLKYDNINNKFLYLLKQFWKNLLTI